MPKYELRKLRQNDPNSRFYIFWTKDRRSKRESTGETEEGAAQTYLAHWILDRGDERPSIAGNAARIADLWSLYFDKHVRAKAASVATAEYCWRNLEPHFGPLLAAAIDQDIVDDYVAKREAGKIGRASGGPTMRRELAALRACLNWCASPKRRVLDPGLVPHFDLPASGEARDRWLKHEEINMLMDAAERARRGDRLSREERFMRIALETAARKEAILQLTWDRVDFETGVIHLEVPGRQRTKKRRADVPISSALRPVLERAYAERTNNAVLDHGGDVWRSVQKIAAAAGFGGEKTERGNVRATGVSPNVFRHTAATHMARRGVPLWLIAKVLGNSIVMVEKVYAKHSPSDLRAAVDAISVPAQ